MLQPNDALAQLNAAIADYLDGELEEARLALIRLAGDPRLAEDTELQQQAQIYLGVVLYFMGERDASWETFVSVSLNDPEYVMDPFVHPPDVETFFKSAREYALDFGRTPPRVRPVPPGEEQPPWVMALVPGRLQLYNDQHTLAWVNEEGDVKLDYRPVVLDPLTTFEEGGIDPKKIAPKARVY